MKILLIQNLTYVPTHGGANKANRCLVEGLTERNHLCRVIAPASDARDHQPSHLRFLDEVTVRGLRVAYSSSELVVFRHKGVEVHAIADASRLRAYVAEQIRTFEPTWTLLSEEPAHALLEVALQTSPSRVVYLAHSTALLGFGPRCFLPSSFKTELLRQTAGIITISRYLQEYIRQWGGLKSTVIPFPIYGSGPFPRLSRFDQGFVTLMNPCAYKGLSIFVALARALPDVPFAAVPTWGTTSTDREALTHLDNVHLMSPVDNIDDILTQTRVLLVPSLWDEAFGLIVIEAMLRGIPVLASNVGGLPEAKLGVDYVLPVRPIERYQVSLNEQLLPLPLVPEQDVTPWLAALRKVLSDRARYEQLATDSHQAALTFVSQVGIEPFEAFLENLPPRAQDTQDGEPTQVSGSEKTKALLPKKRALLAQRLAQRALESASEDG